jgi:glycosyltransferase involved in cell wall biosynthesis
VLQPEVSIVIPLYNKGAYIAETLHSALAQHAVTLEIIAVDNGSTDDGPTIVKQISGRAPSVRFLTSPKRGPGHARNHGVFHAAGRWILFLDADDLIEPNHLRTLWDVSVSNPEKSIIAGGWKEFPADAPEKLTLKTPAGISDESQLLVSAIAASPWAVHAAMIKRELVSRCPWPEEMDGMLAEDNAFWFRLCLSGSVAYSPHAGALYRTQTANCRTQSHDVEKWFAGVHTAVQKNVTALLEVTGLPPNPQQAAALMHLYSSLYRQSVAAANSAVASAAKYEATHWLKHSVSLRHFPPALVARRLLGIAWTERLKMLLSAN